MNETLKRDISVPELFVKSPENFDDNQESDLEKNI